MTLRRSTSRFSLSACLLQSSLALAAAFVPSASAAQQAGVTGGISVPLGRYAAHRAGQPGTSGAGSHPLSALKPGRTIWVTTVDGREVAGQLADVDRETVAVSTKAGRVAIPFVDVRRIEVPDPIANGTKIGAIIGAAAAIPPVIVLSALCENEGCSDGEEAATLGLVALGAGIGALVGAFADSARERRHVAYERTAGAATWHVSPVIARRGAGLGAVIRW